MKTNPELYNFVIHNQQIIYQIRSQINTKMILKNRISLDFRNKLPIEIYWRSKSDVILPHFQLTVLDT